MFAAYPTGRERQFVFVFAEHESFVSLGRPSGDGGVNAVEAIKSCLHFFDTMNL